MSADLKRKRNQSELTSRREAGEPASSSDEPAAQRLRGFGPVGILAVLVILAGNFLFLPLSAILVLVWARLSRTPWTELGYVRPKSWVRTVAFGIIFGAAFKLVMKAIVMPVFGAPPINEAYHFLAGNRAAMPGMLWLIIVGAGFGEETVFRSYLFERFGKLFGRRAWTETLTVVLTSIWFGAIHYPVQGLAGAEQATIVGLVFGMIFALRRQIVLLMVAHVAFDLTALALIYWDVETPVARFIFK
ncbi:MAG: protease family protein [Verrucomicrobiota bacterium]|jgi:membrane protease YdiL (CAAX protease family)